MAVDGMKEPREAEAENGPQEEHPEHHFLLQRGHEIHVGPQHGQCAQTKEQDQPCGAEKQKCKWHIATRFPR